MKILNDRIPKSVSVTGPAGCGKILLVYDLAKEYKKNNKQVVIIHCGKLNAGHITLNDRGWKIYPIKNYKIIQYAYIDILVFDEVQRIDENQLQFIIKKMNENNINAIFSFDPIQVMNSKEKNSNSLNIIDEYVDKSFKITGRIRANKEIYFFVDNLFNC